MKVLRPALAIALAAMLPACATNPLAGTTPPRDGGWRGIHLLNYNSDADLEALSRDVPALAGRGINLIVLEVDYSFAFTSHPELRQGAAPITPQGAGRFADLCRTHHIRLIPEFQSLGHQSWEGETFPLLTKYPELDLTPGAFPNNKGLYCREWDPLNPEVTRIVFALMDEIIDGFGADALHVGMDEVFLLGSDLSPSTKGKDPAELFAKAVSDIHRHVVDERHVEMLMWGDRLYDGKPDKFGEWEASMNGTAPAVDKIPKDIIICPWHYEKRSAYPSIPMFLGKGFRVLPASYNKVNAVTALIRYAQRQDNPRLLGHLFTTWSKQKDLVDYPPLVKGMRLLRPGP